MKQKYPPKRRTRNLEKRHIAINGFGRIGRAAFKIALKSKNIDVVAINDLTDPKTLAHLLKYDTVYGKFEKDVSCNDHKIQGLKDSVGSLVVGKEKYPILAQKEPNLLPWHDLEVDVVIESTGFFVTTDDAQQHIKAGARRVIISAPPKDEITPTHVMGVNTKDGIHDDVVSNASCTTNCISPVVALMHSNFGVEKAMMTTIHSYTSTQNLVDSPSKDLRRARAAAQNIIPTSTGAAISTTKTIPELEGKFDGMAMRVPTITGSVSDITIVTSKDVTVEKVNNVFKKAVTHPLYKGVLDVTDEPIVSSDIIGNPHSTIIDLEFTKVVGGNLVKVLAWYDNEWGYANRLVEMAGNIEL